MKLTSLRAPRRPPTLRASAALTALRGTTHRAPLDEIGWSRRCSAFGPAPIFHTGGARGADEEAAMAEVPSVVGRCWTGLPVGGATDPARAPDVSSAVLEGGAGPSLVLLHGPGEFAGKWRGIDPGLSPDHRVIAPRPAGPRRARMRGGGRRRRGCWPGWAGSSKRTCPSPPVLVGHVLGGALAARFAASIAGGPSRLVLVDSLGPRAFRPRPRFALTMVGFLARPTEHSSERFMRQCSYDLDGLRSAWATAGRRTGRTTWSSPAARPHARWRGCSSTSACGRSLTPSCRGSRLRRVSSGGATTGRRRCGSPRRPPRATAGR